MTALPPEAIAFAAPVTADEDDDVILSVHGVSKHYKLWSSPSVRLRYSLLSQAHRTLRQVLPKHSAPLRSLQRRRERLYRDFTALHELSFEVRRGESLGIIGRNGAGKSTLLQLIAGTLRPSTGRVDVYGRVAALLELGGGFNPEFTGRENVYLNASILGLSHEETDARFDDIVAFADIGQFLEQPVKTYSSGMMLRLAFAVSINVEPDLLIIDEALAVGDVFFTQKCSSHTPGVSPCGCPAAGPPSLPCLPTVSSSCIPTLTAIFSFLNRSRASYGKPGRRRKSACSSAGPTRTPFRCWRPQASTG